MLTRRGILPYKVNILIKSLRWNEVILMYIKDDICYAGELQADIKVTEAKPLRGGMMLVTFSTGERRLFDTTLLEGTAFRPLANEEIFLHPVLFHGVITWNNGEIDIAPEYVYRHSYAYDSIAI